MGGGGGVNRQLSTSNNENFCEGKVYKKINLQISTENKSNLINECAKNSTKLNNKNAVNGCNKKVYKENCATEKNDKNKSYSNALVLNNGANSKQGFMFVFSLIILFLSAIMLVIGVTSSQLFAKKSATGTIAFDVSGAPPLIVNNNLNLYYDNTNGLTYGNSESAGSAISGLSAYNLGISENAKAQDYYLKVEYEFDSTIPQGITFGTNTYTSNGIVMSAMTQESGTNKFVSQSSAVQKGASLNILGYLQTFAYSGQDFTLSATDFTITITVDSTNTFSSIFKNSLTYYGKIGFSYSTFVEPALTFDQNINKVGLWLDDVNNEHYVYEHNGSTHNKLSKCEIQIAGHSSGWQIEFTYTAHDQSQIISDFTIENGIRYQTSKSGFSRTLIMTLPDNLNKIDIVEVLETYIAKILKEGWVGGPRDEDTHLVYFKYNGVTKYTKTWYSWGINDRDSP